MLAQREQLQEESFEDRVIRIDRTRKTVKGGRVSSARVVVAIGDGKGRVGLGVGKALGVPDAINKAIKQARKNVIRIPLDGYTIPHEITAKVGGARIMLKPASRGTGVIAGGATRQLIELSGIRDILTKSLGSGNVFNRAQACFKALQLLRDPRDVAEMRGQELHQLIGREIVDAYAEQERMQVIASAEAKAAAEAAKAAKLAPPPAPVAPVVEAAPEPVVEAPVVEAVAELVVEAPVAEPVAEVVAEPVVEAPVVEEPVVEPVMEAAAAPQAEPKPRPTEEFTEEEPPEE